MLATHTHTRAHIHTYTHAYTHTHTHAHTHTHTLHEKVDRATATAALRFPKKKKKKVKIPYIKFGINNRKFLPSATRRAAPRPDCLVQAVPEFPFEIQSQRLSDAADPITIVHEFLWVKGVLHRGLHTVAYGVAYRLRQAYSALRSAFAGLRGSTPRDAEGYAR